jgi:hypothetical protein
MEKDEKCRKGEIIKLGFSSKAVKVKSVTDLQGLSYKNVPTVINVIE